MSAVPRPTWWRGRPRRAAARAPTGSRPGAGPASRSPRPRPRVERPARWRRTPRRPAARGRPGCRRPRPPRARAAIDPSSPRRMPTRTRAEAAKTLSCASVDSSTHCRSSITSTPDPTWVRTSAVSAVGSAARSVPRARLSGTNGERCRLRSPPVRTTGPPRASAARSSNVLVPMPASPSTPTGCPSPTTSVTVWISSSRAPPTGADATGCNLAGSGDVAGWATP